MKSVDIRIWNWLVRHWFTRNSFAVEKQSTCLGCMGSAFEYKKIKNKEKNEIFYERFNIKYSMRDLTENILWGIQQKIFYERFNIKYYMRDSTENILWAI